MRLLLIKSHNIKPPSQPTIKTIADIITPQLENIFAKKCHLQQVRTPSSPKLIIHSTFHTHVPGFSFIIAVEIAEGGKVVYRSTLLRDGRVMMLWTQMKVNLMHKVHRKIIATEDHILEMEASGQLQLLSKITYSSLLLRSSSQLAREVSARVKALHQASLAVLNTIILQTNHPSVKGEEMSKGRSVRLEKIKRHIYFSCYDLGLSEKANQYRHPTEETLRQREKIIKSLLGPEAKEQALRESVLFALQEGRSIANSKEWRRQFESAYYFQKLLQVPVPKVVGPAQNAHIFNQIQIEKPEKVIPQSLPIANACLKVMAVSAAYVGHKQGKLQFIPKVLLAKTAKDGSAKERRKVIHQRNIVRLFSSAHSGYLLKYYSCGQENFALRNQLLMDYHPGSLTLLEHLQLRKHSLPLESKLTLLAHISNGLRFLAYYKVVHMDLTLNNILIYDNFLPKIIDFGEAFHRETIESTIKNAYSPGFTLPYCAPEVFMKGKDFSSSQDIFSFGVVIFRVLLNILPFFPSDSLIAIYKAKAYHQRFLLAPEGVAAIGQEHVCFLLLQLVNLCLRVEAEGRPLPIWSTIILKEILTEIFH